MEHPIIPPPELVEQWLGEYFGCSADSELSDFDRYLATAAARWGADQELEACCEWANATGWEGAGDSLRTDRRPKPPSLKELALAKLAAMERLWEASGNEPSDLVRRALELLND